MKLLHVISSTNPEGGGPIEGIKQLQSSLTNIGVNVELASCDAPDAHWLLTSDVTIHALGPSSGKYGYTPRLLPWVRNNAHRFDAIIIEGLWQYHSFATWQVLRKSKIPYFVFTHGMLDPWFKHTYPLKHLKKWLYWPWADYRVLRDARSVLFTCEEERLLARQSFWLYKCNEAVTSYGTAPPPENQEDLRHAFSSRFPHLLGKRLLLFLSRIHEKKGCDILIDAFAKIAHRDDQLHLVMAGPDQSGWLKELKQQAHRQGFSHRITFTGMLQGDMKWGAFYASEVFILPSHQENFGIVVAEALACGKPVLISNKVNIWREIEKDQAGIIDNDTVNGTVRNLTKWLEMDANSRQEMSRQAKNCFATRFHIKRATERLLEIIEGDSNYWLR